MTGAWQALVTASAGVTKPKCAEGKATFRGLDRNERDHRDIVDSLLVKGERLRDLLHQVEERRGRKAADCVFFLRHRDDTVQIVIVELKTGDEDEESFEQQLSHAREDARRHASRCGLKLRERVVFGAPRLPPSVRGGRKGFQRRWPDFEVAKEMETLLAAVLL